MMTLWTPIFRYLDRLRFLGCPIWEFSMHSFFHRYGQVFLWKMALSHPQRLCRAIQRSKNVWSAGPQGGIWHVGEPRNDRYDLVAASYCQKPIGPNGGCPVGRFNHRCLSAENNAGPTVEICTTCPVQAIADLARRTAADFYIMTSGLDLAKHLFLPSIRESRTRRGLFFLCSYSSYPFLLAMLLAGMEGDLLTFCCGDCINYHDFSLADRGEKNAQTKVEPAVWSRFVPPACAQTKGHFKRGVSGV